MMPDLVHVGLIVEDRYTDAYRVLTRKVWPERVRGYPLGKNKTIPATDKLRVWIKESRDKFDFVCVLVDRDTPAHSRDPQYFQELQRICDAEGAALIIVKVELESWLLTDPDSIARWKLGDETAFSFARSYSNTASDPWEPKDAVLGLVKQIARYRGSREPESFDPQWAGQIAERLELNEDSLSRNCSLGCFYTLIRDCGRKDGAQRFAAYVKNKETHCKRPEIPVDD